MTVGELIKILSAFDENMLVLVDGFEDGFDELKEKNIRRRQLRDDKDVDPYWEGRYHITPDWNTPLGDIIAVVLGRA